MLRFVLKQIARKVLTEYYTVPHNDKTDQVGNINFLYLRIGTIKKIVMNNLV